MFSPLFVKWIIAPAGILMGYGAGCSLILCILPSLGTPVNRCVPIVFRSRVACVWFIFQTSFAYSESCLGINESPFIGSPFVTK